MDNVRNEQWLCCDLSSGRLTVRKVYSPENLQAHGYILIKAMSDLWKYYYSSQVDKHNSHIDYCIWCSVMWILKGVSLRELVKKS